VFIKLFKSNSQISIIILPIFMALCWFNAFLSPAPVNVEHAMPLYKLLVGWTQPVPIAASIFAYIVVVLTGFLYNYIANEQEFLPKRTYLPGLFYCVLMSSSPLLLQCHPLIFANLFITLMLNALVNTYRQNTAFNGVFQGGFFLGIASLFYFPVVLLFPLLLVSLLVLRPFIWREWLIIIIGFIFPYIYVVTYYFWNDSLNFFWEDRIGYNIINGKRDWLFFTEPNPAFWMLLGFLVLALVRISSGFAIQKLKAKKGYTLLFWLLPISFLTILIAPSISMITLSLLAVPAAVILANYFFSMKKTWLAGLLLWIIYLTELVIIWKDSL
jgi:hypothetical protein